jgi:L-2,4-diaminobutyric acid acetyltransferase
MQPGLNGHEVMLRKPNPDDGYAIYRLIKQSPPLDPNSVYSYYLLCRHFSDTGVVAEQQGEIVGFISAYLEPNSPDTLFVWQVVVADSQRGKGLAKRMLKSLLESPACADVRILESTVNPSNQASRRLFESFANQQGCALTESIFLEEEQFGGEEHEKEILLSIGPLNVKSSNQEKHDANF